MKRDIDLVRSILLELESSDYRRDSSTIRIAGYTADAITEHMHLLMESGLVEGIQAYSIEHKVKWIDLRLTWSGHDFLDAARSEVVWAETLTAVRSRIGSIPFEALKKLLTEAAHSSVGSRAEVPAGWRSYFYASGGERMPHEQPA